MGVPVPDAPNDMTHITLINPNTSKHTTAMMTGIARGLLPPGVTIDGVTAERGVPMIIDDRQLAASVAGVVEMGLAAASRSDGIIISAFGDPGIDQLRPLVDIPVVGICEAGMLEASKGGRRFGIATVTPDLVASFSSKAIGLGLGHLYTGTRLTPDDPLELASNAIALEDALAITVQQSFELDGAEAVIIGGGPLGQAAVGLAPRFKIPVIAPISTAVEQLLRHMADRSDNIREACS